MKRIKGLVAALSAALIITSVAGCAMDDTNPYNPDANYHIKQISEYLEDAQKQMKNEQSDAKLKELQGKLGGTTSTDPSNQGGGELEFESTDSLLSYIVMDAWGSGTTISGTGPYSCTPGTAWDENGMVSLPFSFDPGTLTGATHIIIEADLSGMSLREDSSATPSVELKVQKNDTESGTKVLNITNSFKDGKAVVALSDVSFLAEAKQFMISVRGSGTFVLKAVSKGKQKGASNQQGGEPGTGDEPPADTGLISAATVLDWNEQIIIAGSKFATATVNSSIKITYVTDGTTDYQKFKMSYGNGNAKELYAGTPTGFTIDTTSASADNLHGCSFTTAPSATAVELTYKPSAEEWTNIKANEFRIFGHGAKITCVKLVVGDPVAAELTKTSILSGLQTGTSVWDSGSDVTDNGDGTYTITGASAGAGSWGGNLAVIISCVGAGDLNTFTHIVLDADLSSFTLAGDNESYPAIELKIMDAGSSSKMINATSLYNATTKKAEIPLSTVNFLDTATKIQFTIRGSGTITLNGLSKAK